MPTKTAPVRDVVLDQDGELVLRIGSDATVGEPCKFKVDPSALRRASTVFKAMLFGPWIESRPIDASQWIVELPEDEPLAFKALLGIIHNMYNLVPATVSMDLLFDILVICDKYNMTSVIAPWASGWMKDVEKENENETNSPKMIFIAWELGNESLFAAELEKLIFNSYFETSDSESLLWDGPGGTKGTHNLSSTCHLGPIGFIERIKILRTSLIQNILDFLQNEIETRIGQQPGGRPSQLACKCVDRTQYSYSSPKKEPACDDVILGGIWRGIKTCTVLMGNDLEVASGVYLSVEELIAAFDDIFSQVSTLGIGHERCGVYEKFKVFIHGTRTDGAWRVGLLRRTDKTRMARQRKKIQVGNEV